MLDIQKPIIILIILISIGLCSARSNERINREEENFESQIRQRHQSDYKKYYRSHDEYWRNYRRPGTNSRVREPHQNALPPNQRTFRDTQNNERRLPRERGRAARHRNISRTEETSRVNLSRRLSRARTRASQSSNIVRRKIPVKIKKQQDKQKIRIVFVSISDFYFKSGSPLTLTAYINNEMPDTTAVKTKLSLFIHKQGRIEKIPIKSISKYLLADKITPYKFSFIWYEEGYQTDYKYKHGDYKFELLLEYKDIKIKKTRILYARPINYTFFWNEFF